MITSRWDPPELTRVQPNASFCPLGMRPPGCNTRGPGSQVLRLHLPEQWDTGCQSPPFLRHISQFPNFSRAALLGSLPVARLPGIHHQWPMAGGSKPRSWVLSCPDTIRVAGVGEEEDCTGVTTNPISYPNWVHTWARTVWRPRSTAPGRNHAFHPLGFSWVVKAEEGGLTQAQHTAFRERKCLEGEAGVRQPSSHSTNRLTSGSKEPSPPALQYPQGPCLTSPVLETGTGRVQ